MNTPNRIHTSVENIIVDLSMARRTESFAIELAVFATTQQINDIYETQTNWCSRLTKPTEDTHVMMIADIRVYEMPDLPSPVIMVLHRSPVHPSLAQNYDLVHPSETQDKVETTRMPTASNPKMTLDEIQAETPTTECDAVLVRAVLNTPLIRHWHFLSACTWECPFCNEITKSKYSPRIILANHKPTCEVYALLQRKIV